MIEFENLAKTNSKFFPHYKRVLSSVLDKGQFILGEQVDLFEDEFAQYCGAKYCVGVASGLDALILALDSTKKIKRGDEVILASNSYMATVIAVVRLGLIPVFVEPNVKTYNIDEDKIEEKITEKTSAILITHLYGNACNMTKIMEIAEGYNLEVIEDCAQAHGTSFAHKYVGTFGTGCFSFYPTKNLGCLGDGGAIITNDKERYELLLSLSNYGQIQKNHFGYIGYNSRLDETQAAFLRIKLKHLDEINNHKKSLALIYQTKLENKFIKPEVSLQSNFHIYPIRHKDRDNLKEYLLANGVQTAIHYPVSIANQPIASLINAIDMPIANEIANTILSLPISFSTIKDEVEEIIKIMNNYDG